MTLGTEPQIELHVSTGTTITHADYVQKLREALDVSDVLSQLGADRPGLIEERG